jgi:hypothetical protein
MDFLSQLGCSFRSEAESLSTVLEWLNEEIWLSLEYKSCTLFSVDGCRIFIHYHRHCGMKAIMMLSSSIAAVLFCSVVCFYWSSGGSIGSLYLLIISCVWLFWCWELLMIRWRSFGPCLTLWLDNWRRQVNIALWSTRLHLLFKLPPFNFRIHVSQITW